MLTRPWPLIIVGLAFIAGCAPTKTSTSISSPLTRPQFQKTFGVVQAHHGSFDVIYKNIQLAVDALQSATQYKTVDYLLLTETGAPAFAKTSPPARKNLKIVSPPSHANTIKKKGYGAVKGLGQGKTVLLKKSDTYLFLKTVASDATQNYFLEFDNGRTVYFHGDRWNVDELRPFLYQLRDEGKGIELAFFRAGEPGPDWGVLMDVISLLQPETAILIPVDQKKISVDAAWFQTELEKKLFYGKVFFAKSKDEFPF